MKKLRRELGFPDTAEFKFHKSNYLRTDIDSFFNYIVAQVLKNNQGTIKRAKLRFDRRGERRIRDELRVYLSRELDNKKKNVFIELKFVDSKGNILIQLADMIAGCISSYYKRKDQDLYKIIKKRVENVMEFK